MAHSKRKLQKDATRPDQVSDGAIALEAALSELALHFRLRIEAALRIGMSKVRIDMLPIRDAEILLHLVEKGLSECRLTMLMEKDNDAE